MSGHIGGDEMSLHYVESGKDIVVVYFDLHRVKKVAKTSHLCYDLTVPPCAGRLFCRCAVQESDGVPVDFLAPQPGGLS